MDRSRRVPQKIVLTYDKTSTMHSGIAKKSSAGKEDTLADFWREL
jgi:hypothetical protein